ncbi:MAG: dihydroorotate dehydrogenase [Eubacteriales bacterium]|nr:dihydroorotate dehydrogenase [Eubacteriales bacterium]
MKNLAFKIGNVEFKNPVFGASGTFGSGKEFTGFIDLNKIGGIVLKGVSKEPWLGNETPRLAEVYGGMLNSIGLQNPGVEEFIKEELAGLREYDTKLVVNVCGHSIKDYVEVVERLNGEDFDVFELNISCPNLEKGCLSFGQDPKEVEKIIGEIKKVAKKPIIAKLTPNVTDITEIAKAAEASGADAVSLINTIAAMKIDIHKRKPILAKKIGGMSGPAIKPIAVRMVYQVSKAVNIPIIGMGGICNGDDAIEFILAGASGVAIGTANFFKPTTTIDVLNGIEKYMDQYGINDISEIRGIIE